MTKRHIENLANNYIASRIRNKRCEMGFTLKDMAEKMDVSFQLIHKIETGYSHIMAMDIIKFANVFEVHPSYFFEGCPELTKLPTGFVCFLKNI